MSTDIKIFMCCHKTFDLVPPLCTPIQCGAALNGRVPGSLSDADGDNISARNREYCELTAQYYAWKNVDAGYYGFCHYRRFFCFTDAVKRPYTARKKLSDTDIAKYFGSEESMSELIRKYDIIVPRAESTGVSVYDHYCNARYHYKSDLDLFLEILREKIPLLSSAAEEYFGSEKQYFCNMFIMKKEFFYEYCDMLFPILKRFDELRTPHGNFQSDRVCGYLGERFLGVYVTEMKKLASICELPRIDTECSVKKIVGCAVLPPESKRRAAAKRILNMQARG